MEEMTPLEAALDYASRGLEVFPLRGKMPAISAADGGHGLHDATTETDQLVEWFDMMGFTNIGIAIPKNVVVMDVDTQHGGDEVFKAWVAEHGKEWIAAAPRQRTGNGGIHAWFWHEGQLPRYKVKGIDGVEMGRFGRYVVAAPSVHPDTRQTYVWERELPDHYELLAERPGLPAWLLELYVDDVSLEIPDGPLRDYGSGDALDDAVHEFTSWSRLLGSSGWKLVKGDGDSDHSVWRHPTATGKQSATIKYGCLFVYSPNTPFPETEAGNPAGVTLFTGYSTLEHGGDIKRAVRILKENGYLESGPDWTQVDDLVGALKAADEIEKQLTAANSDEIPEPPGDDSKLGPRIHWPTFWLQQDDLDSRWLSEPLIAAGRAHALFAGAKTGKSLLLLQACAALATGRPFLDKPAHDPIPVLYADYEMTEEDLRQRLTQFGYGPEDDLSPLNYFLLGAGQALDTLDGGLALIETAHDAAAKYVVIDTTARAVQGGENDADTLRAFSRCSGTGLKRLGIAWTRADHSGKSVEKGQRGTSAKNDDVDVVWRLSPAGGENVFSLEATHQRMGWVPRKVPLELHKLDNGGLEWRRHGTRTYSVGVEALAKHLAEQGVPTNSTHRNAEDVLHAAGVKFNKTLLSEALSWRIAETSYAMMDDTSH